LAPGKLGTPFAVSPVPPPPPVPVAAQSTAAPAKSAIPDGKHVTPAEKPDQQGTPAR
jgi:hypothetical protein